MFTQHGLFGDLVDVDARDVAADLVDAPAPAAELSDARDVAADLVDAPAPAAELFDRPEPAT